MLLLVRVAVRRRGMFVRMLAVFVSSGRVLLRFVVLASFVMMRCLMVMMRGSVVVACGLVVMVTRGMFWRLCHLCVKSRPIVTPPHYRPSD